MLRKFFKKRVANLRFTHLAPFRHLIDLVSFLQKFQQQCCITLAMLFFISECKHISLCHSLLKLTASITAACKHCFDVMKNVEIIAFILVTRTSSITDVRKSIFYVFAAWQQSRRVVSARNPHQLHNFVQKKAVMKAFQLLMKTHFSNLKNLEMGIVFVKPYWEFCSVFGGHITQCIMYLSACFWRAFRKMKCPLQWAFCIVKPSAVGITETRAFVRWKNFYVYLGVLRRQKH